MWAGRLIRVEWVKEGKAGRSFNRWIGWDGGSIGGWSRDCCI